MAIRTRLPSRMSLLLQVLLLLVVPVFIIFHSAHALKLQSRSVGIASALPSATTSYTFSYTYSSVAPLAAVKMEFCDNTALLSLPCNPPSGLDVSSVALLNQTGNVGFSIDGTNSNANTLVLTRPVSPALAIPSSYVFDNAINPSAPAQDRICPYNDLQH